jgi:hypothetical protein
MVFAPFGPLSESMMAFLCHAFVFGPARALNFRKLLIEARIAEMDKRQTAGEFVAFSVHRLVAGAKSSAGCG